MMFLFMACVGEPEDPGEPLVDEFPEAWIEYYRADSLISAGGFEFDEEYLVRRFMDPPAGTILEEFVATADSTLTEVEFVVDADAGTFELHFSDDSYEGTGNLYGEAWAWTSWDSHSVATDGSWVDSEDSVTDGAIHAEKTGFSPEGEQEWTLVEDLAPLTEEQWTEATAELP